MLLPLCAKSFAGVFQEASHKEGKKLKRKEGEVNKWKLSLGLPNDYIVKIIGDKKNKK